MAEHGWYYVAGRPRLAAADAAAGDTEPPVRVWIRIPNLPPDCENVFMIDIPVEVVVTSRRPPDERPVPDAAPPDELVPGIVAAPPEHAPEPVPAIAAPPVDDPEPVPAIGAIDAPRQPAIGAIRAIDEPAPEPVPNLRALAERFESLSAPAQGIERIEQRPLVTTSSNNASSASMRSEPSSDTLSPSPWGPHVVEAMEPEEKRCKVMARVEDGEAPIEEETN